MHNQPLRLDMIVVDAAVQLAVSVPAALALSGSWQCGSSLRYSLAIAHSLWQDDEERH